MEGRNGGGRDKSDFKGLERGRSKQDRRDGMEGG